MKQISFIFGFFSLLWFGCDQAAPTQALRIQPKFAIEFVSPRLLEGGAASKTEALSPDFVKGLWTISLQVTSKGGRDYSPKDAQTVDDTIQDEATFEFDIPLDSSYTFAVQYRQNGVLRAQGSTFQKITKDNASVRINVTMLPVNTNAPFIGFDPSLVSVKSTNGTMMMVLKFAGSNETLKGVAAKLNISGIDPSALRFRRAIAVRQSYGYDLAWTWPTGKTGPFTLDTLMVPLQTPADVRLAFQQGALQALLNPNALKTFAVTDARVLIR